MSLRDLNQKMGKLGPDVSSARKAVKLPGNLSKIVKKALLLADLLVPGDKEASAKVLREAKLATHRIYDVAKKRLLEVPDHKTRLAAIALELAYSEGKDALGRTNMSFEDLGTLLAKLQQSPAAVAGFLALNGSPAPVIEIEASVVQEYPPEKTGHSPQGSSSIQETDEI